MADNILAITIGAILVNNFVLSKFLGICPFLGVSKKLETALGMSGAVIFVMTLASLVTSTIYKYVLSRDLVIGDTTINLSFLKILVFIVVIASLVQLVEIILQKISPPLYQALGIFLPLITTNCAVLGAAELNVQAGRGVIESTVFGFCSALGFSLALVLFASLREKLDLAKVPVPLQGTAIGLITAGILAMVFMGFSGLV
ncbi:electron transport complex protein RnfA [Tichowtungia aerotolerans]|uniref:Ion-translocating oxidoreductase complex subunit A n=1 Tax=Tichowtungia aerotolerans TaxID=2697043 RepID=A0A6P1M6W5_9BACT|nr:RnfABCDGE type electron transport complex subunit A [Tichowtungia aerotolerans]QHI70529.1 RnfABCDGE type electron transport complex subunit A [Tichowtungia aerotolerans]